MNDYLTHHGIKGMKWGVRRYQNKDGTLTPAGKKRANKGLKDAERLSKSHAIIEDSTRILTPHLSNKQGVQTLVPSDIKTEYKKRLDRYIKESSIMNKRYETLFDDIITDNGKDFVYVLLKDKKTGSGYEYRTELKH